MVLVRACERLGWSIAEQRCVVQGFGNVGSVAAHELHELGATVLGVSDISGRIHSDEGLDVPALEAYARENGSLEECDAGRRITNEELLEPRLRRRLASRPARIRSPRERASPVRA